MIDAHVSTQTKLVLYLKLEVVNYWKDLHVCCERPYQVWSKLNQQKGWVINLWQATTVLAFQSTREGHIFDPFSTLDRYEWLPYRIW